MSSFKNPSFTSLFGIPYVVAPMEAESQCAFLNAINLTDGTITDDSDIWLFGGKRVYKNFFNQKKLVMEYEVENIERLFQMDRKKMIQLAMLVGSDYTTGERTKSGCTAFGSNLIRDCLFFRHPRHWSGDGFGNFGHIPGHTRIRRDQ
jgi:5'-3' exonuclease